MSAALPLGPPTSTLSVPVELSFAVADVVRLPPALKLSVVVPARFAPSASSVTQPSNVGFSTLTFTVTAVASAGMDDEPGCEPPIWKDRYSLVASGVPALPAPGRAIIRTIPEPAPQSLPFVD